MTRRCSASTRGPGRFWVGVMFDPLTAGSQARSGQMHSFTLAGGLRAESDRAELHNGFAWAPDGRSFFVAHSRARQVYRYDFTHDGSGQLGQRQLFATVPDDLGIPDGAAVDSQCGYWCCLHGGGRVRRFLPDGTPDRDILLPVSQPTMCAFGGPELDILYITTASDNLPSSQRDAEPLAGALLSCRPGARGMPRAVFVR
ncbi:hypothetical protein GI374_05570 [Paracoccus sp. S-4012]|nr:hypothetical protein [Paracoccus sp. S-4012]